MSFLPITKEEMTARGWEAADFVYVTGDAYVDHPSFGSAIITRLLESQGYRVAVLAQPRFDTPEDMTRDRKSTRLNSSHWNKSRMPSSA